jgi:putative transposase
LLDYLVMWTIWRVGFCTMSLLPICPRTDMPRTARASQGGYSYHVLNRGNARAVVFHKDGDYQAFLELAAEASLRIPMRILAYSLMPNHFHLALWPEEDGALSRWMHWLMTTHVRRYQRHYNSSGHIWQGRFKAFPVQDDEHLLVLLRYIERNALRAHLVDQAENWPWSSLRWLGNPSAAPVPLNPGTIPRGKDWLNGVNSVQHATEDERIRECIRRDRPFGHENWVKETAKALGLEFSLRVSGRSKAK